MSTTEFLGIVSAIYLARGMPESMALVLGLLIVLAQVSFGLSKHF